MTPDLAIVEPTPTRTAGDDGSMPTTTSTCLSQKKTYHPMFSSDVPPKDPLQRAIIDHAHVAVEEQAQYSTCPGGAACRENRK